MDNTVILSAGSTLLNYPVMLWSTLVSSFGTIPALIISGLLVVGLIVVTRYIFGFLARSIRKMFCNKEVSLLPQTMVQ